MGSDVEVGHSDRLEALVALGRHPLHRAESEAEALEVVRVAGAIARVRERAYREGYLDADNGRDPKW